MFKKLNKDDLQKAILIKQPIKAEISVDTRREDHPDHSKVHRAFDDENAKILKRLEDVNWIKNKSVLDLSELIHKNLDRQPELLAMLQPELKKTLLYNPALLKTLDKLENKDPIN